MRLKYGLGNVLLVGFSIGITLLVIEVALRVYHGKLLDFTSVLPDAPNRVVQRPRAEYDSLLGWVPADGFRNPPGTASVDAENLRSNGSGTPTSGPRVLVVGDSFTYGDEVPDSMTWPAQLGRVLEAQVSNAGVFGYGIDQAFLRATGLLDTHQPQWVVLAFIRDDVNRAEYSYYYGWKPYFVLAGDTLILRNVPVSRGAAPRPPFDGLRRALGYSLLTSAVARRVLPTWWDFGRIVQAHDDGVEISIRLARLLDEDVREAGGQLIVVGLATGAWIGNNLGMEDILERMEAHGIGTLNLVPEIEGMVESGEVDLYMPMGHYAPKLNRWVANQVAAHLTREAFGAGK